jgi:DNA-binding NarL/FixJ family response regulator
MEKKITVGIFDDHPVVLEAVICSINHFPAILELLFSTSSKEKLYQYTEQQLPQVLVLDIISDDVKALELFEHFRTYMPELPIIAYSSLSSPVLVENLLFLGIKGYVNKRQPVEDLLQAIFLVAEGHIAVPNDYKYLTSKYVSDNTAILTKREIEIVNLIALEHSSSEIAEILGLSVNTIENHRKRIFLKLNVKNVVGMVMEASRLAYIQEKEK